MQHGLKQIQYHENCYIEGQQIEALNELLKGVKFLHQNIMLFKNQVKDINQAPWIDDLHWLARTFAWLDEYFTQTHLLENKAHYLRKLPKSKSIISQLKLQQSELPSSESITQLLTSSRYCKFVLTFTQWLIQQEKNTFSGEKENSIKLFSSKNLSNAWGEISIALEKSDNFTVQQFLAYQGLLESNLLTGLSLGNVFSKQKSDIFRSPWLDIKNGLNEFSMLNVISEIAYDEDDKALQSEYVKWIKRKQDSLLHALQQSKQQALLKPIYWDS